MINFALTFFGRLSPRIKVVSTIAGAIGALAGMVVAVPPAWTLMDLPEFATKQWVNKDIRWPMRIAQSQTQQQVIDLQIDVATGKLDQLDNARASLEIEKLKATDDAVKARAEAQIRKIDRDASTITDQIKTLRLIPRNPQP